MKRFFTFFLLSVLMLAVSPYLRADPSTAAAGTDPTTAFTAGVKAYQASDFSLAKAQFDSAEHLAVSAALEYNYGNACYQAGDYGMAILHYMRALTLSPGDPDTLHNMAMAQQAANISPVDAGWLDRHTAWLSENTWTWLAVIAGWATLGFIFLPRLFRWRGAWPWLMGTLCLLIAVVAGIGIWGTHAHSHDGVVLHADTPLKQSPTSGSQAALTLPAGTVAQTLRQYGGYYYVHTSDDHFGWVDEANYTPVWK